MKRLIGKKDKILPIDQTVSMLVTNRLKKERPDISAPPIDSTGF